MNAENQIISLREELAALKGTFARKASELQVYSYSVNLTVPSSDTIFTVTFLTDDGTNTIASVETKKCRRIPFNGGAKWYVSFSLDLDETPPVNRTLTIRSMRRGRLEVS